MNPGRALLRPPAVCAGLVALATINPGRAFLRPPAVRAGLVALAAIIGLTGLAWAAPAPVATIEIEGVISPVTLRLVGLAIDRAQAERAQALVIQLDTPGGLERSMRSIVQQILSSDIPVVVYVAPTGARAASAGVFLTIAAHVAAMAPATNIGAAHPVAVGGGSLDKESMKKVENDAAAFARTIAATRGRNVEWAEKAVRQSVSATEREAVKLNIVDLVADSTTDLLDKIDGRRVKTPRGAVVLRTKGAVVQSIQIGFRDRILNVITDPNVAYVSFSGYNAYATAAGTATGHVFKVVYSPGQGTATWTNLDYNIGDQPITDIALDSKTGDLFVSTDFGVDTLKSGATTWTPAAGSLPPVATYGLTIDSNARVLYAATHGRGAWMLSLQ